MAVLWTNVFMFSILCVWVPLLVCGYSLEKRAFQSGGFLFSQISCMRNPTTHAQLKLEHFLWENYEIICTYTNDIKVEVHVTVNKCKVPFIIRIVEDVERLNTMLSYYFHFFIHSNFPPEGYPPVNAIVGRAAFTNDTSKSNLLHNLTHLIINATVLFRRWINPGLANLCLFIQCARLIIFDVTF